MQRVHSVIYPQGKTKELLDHMKKTTEQVPNFISVLANSPVVLEAYLNFNKILRNGKLNFLLREQIAIAVAGFNGCDYCASAHTFMARQTGVNSLELHHNLQCRSSNEQTQAVLNFVRSLLETKGNIDHESFKSIKSAGFSDEEIIEIQAHVALNIFSNYFNESIQTHIDFPIVRTMKSGKAA